MDSPLVNFNLVEKRSSLPVKVCGECGHRRINQEEDLEDNVVGPAYFYCHRCLTYTCTVMGFPEPLHAVETINKVHSYSFPGGVGSSPIPMRGNMVGEMWRDWINNKFDRDYEEFYRHRLVDRIYDNLRLHVIKKANESIERLVDKRLLKNIQPYPIKYIIAFIVIQSKGGLRIRPARIASLLGISRQVFQSRKKQEYDPPMKLLLEDIKRVTNNWERSIIERL